MNIVNVSTPIYKFTVEMNQDEFTDLRGELRKIQELGDDGYYPRMVALILNISRSV